mgnify:CR=1 FL=1
MKECPVCHATCFNNMEICYGCLTKLPKVNEKEKHYLFIEEDFYKSILEELEQIEFKISAITRELREAVDKVDIQGKENDNE